MTHSSKAGFLGGLAAHRLVLPALFTAHGWAFTPGAPASRRLLALLAERLAARWSCRIVCVSECDRRLAVRYRVAPPERLVAIPNGLPDHPARARPGRLDRCASPWCRGSSPRRITPPSEAYPRLPRISIDYALMERTDRAVVVPAPFAWDDLGDWTALERVLRGDSPNVVVGRHVGLDTRGAILYTTGDDLIVTVGLEDVVIVRDGEITLIARKDRVQEPKQVLARLRGDPALARYV